MDMEKIVRQNTFIKTPDEIYFGYGALERLQGLKGRARYAFIVTDKTLVKVGIVKKVTDQLDAIGLPYSIYDGVVPDPTRTNVYEAIQQIKDEGIDPDWFIGVGGGSNMDCSKAVRLFYEVPGLDFEELSKSFEGFPIPSGKYKVCCISTTSGTGSEMSFGSVIIDDTKIPHQKNTLNSITLIPNIAIADPELVLDLPPKATASTGTDALIHAMEGYTSRRADDFTAPIAKHMAGLIFKYLPIAYKEPHNREAREKVHMAQMFASMCFVTSGLGLAHAFGLAMGAVYGTPHGIACSIPYPAVINFNIQTEPEIYASLADEFGIEYDTPEEGAFKMKEKYVEIIKGLDLPFTLQDIGVSEEQFRHDLPELVRQTRVHTDLCVTNPRNATDEDLAAIWEDVFFGRY